MSTLSLGYYPGCSGLGTSMEYDASSRLCCAALGITLRDIPDWTCCGSTPAHTVDRVLSTAISARNFAQAERAGLSEITTPCPSCLKNLKNALHAMEDDFFRARVEALTEKPITQAHTVRSLLQVFVEEVGLDAVRAKVVRPLTGLKVVPYYGCLMNRPGSTMQFDNPENPVAMDNLLKALGATVLPYPFKVECCGASFGVADRTIVAHLSGKLLEAAKDAGADCIVVACPLCQMNLDLRQEQIEKAAGAKYALPVPYFTQLAGYALGERVPKLGFDKLAVDVQPLLEQCAAKAEGEEAQ